MSGKVKRHTAALQAQRLHQRLPVVGCPHEAVQQQHGRQVGGAAAAGAVGSCPCWQGLQQAKLVAAAGGLHAAPPLLQARNLPLGCCRRLPVKLLRQGNAAAGYGLR